MYYLFKKSIGNTLLLLLVVAAIFSCKPEQNLLETTNFLLDSIKSRNIPDTRVEVFSFKASLTGDQIILRGKTSRPDVHEMILHKLSNLNIAFSDSIMLLPDPSLKDKTWGLITLSVANIRYTPAHSGEMATQAIMGTPVKVYQEENGWYLIQTPDKYVAWTESASLQLLSQDELNQWKKASKIVFIEDNGFVWMKPDSPANPVSDLVLGSILVTEDKPSSWQEFVSVKLPDGRAGFVKRKSVLDYALWSKQAKPDSASLVKTAMAHMGKPYLWGGTSAKGFDCSGFTKTVYQANGIILARDASQQVNQGTEVPRISIWAELLTGDLLFFGRKATGEQSERVSHVGMYLGNSEFIHCSGLVRINSLDSTRTNFKPYYLTNLLHVKRIMGSENTPSSFSNHPWY